MIIFGIGQRIPFNIPWHKCLYGLANVTTWLGRKNGNADFVFSCLSSASSLWFSHELVRSNIRRFLLVDTVYDQLYIKAYFFLVTWISRTKVTNLTIITHEFFRQKSILTNHTIITHGFITWFRYTRPNRHDRYIILKRIILFC